MGCGMSGSSSWSASLAGGLVVAADASAVAVRVSREGSDGWAAVALAWLAGAELGDAAGAVAVATFRLEASYFGAAGWVAAGTAAACADVVGVMATSAQRTALASRMASASRSA